ncbi:MAG TPA: ABC transporter permease [Puia sp.]|jgi:hypothetical protein
MLSNYFKVAFRSLRQNKTFSILNILGLSLGMASSLLILLWVRDERSVDGFHTPLAAELKTTIPEIETAVGIDMGDNFTFRGNDKTLKAKGGYAGERFFSMFSFPLLLGNAATALKRPRGYCPFQNARL